MKMNLKKIVENRKTTKSKKKKIFSFSEKYFSLNVNLKFERPMNERENSFLASCFFYYATNFCYVGCIIVKNSSFRHWDIYFEDFISSRAIFSLVKNEKRFFFRNCSGNLNFFHLIFTLAKHTLNYHYKCPMCTWKNSNSKEQ